MTMWPQRSKIRVSAAVAKAVLPWLLLFVAARPLSSFRWPPFEWSGGLLHWLSFVLDDTAFVLPFLVFAGGVALRDTLGYSRQVIRAVVFWGVVASTVCYLVAAWAAPAVEHQVLVRLGAETETARQFGARTPVGVLRNLRFVEANPPDEYSLRVSSPHRFPPNVLRWELHRPPAMAVFGFINVVLGVIAAQLTVDLKRGRRRNARVAIGLLSAIAFLALQRFAAPTETFLQSGVLRSGIVAAWAPLSFPLAEGFLLIYLVRGRRWE